MDFRLFRGNRRYATYLVVGIQSKGSQETVFKRYCRQNSICIDKASEYWKLVKHAASP